MDIIALTTQSQCKFWISSRRVYLYLHLTWRVMLCYQFQFTLQSDCVLTGLLFGSQVTWMCLVFSLCSFKKSLLIILALSFINTNNLSLNIRYWYSRLSTTYSKHKQLKTLADLERRQLINWCIGMSEKGQGLCMSGKWQVTPDKALKLNGESEHALAELEHCRQEERMHSRRKALYLNIPSLLTII